MFKKSKNLNDRERTVRMLLGLGLLAVGLFVLTDILRVATIVLSTYFLVTGIVAYCPVSEVLGSSSSRRSTTSRTHRKKRRR